MKLYIKYMVGIRCKMIVKEELNNLGLHYITVDVGEANIWEDITAQQKEKIKSTLIKSGLELLDDKNSFLVEKIKNVIVEMVHYADELPGIPFPEYLGKKLKHDYQYLDNLFLAVKCITIEQYLVAHKIERVKELLVYNGLTLTEISDQMNYKSVAHLSSQFKKVTGLTPSHFKQLKDKRHMSIIYSR